MTIFFLLSECSCRHTTDVHSSGDSRTARTQVEASSDDCDHCSDSCVPGAAVLACLGVPGTCSYCCCGGKCRVCGSTIMSLVKDRFNSTTVLCMHIYSCTPGYASHLTIPGYLTAPVERSITDVHIHSCWQSVLDKSRQAWSMNSPLLCKNVHYGAFI